MYIKIICLLLAAMLLQLSSCSEAPASAVDAAETVERTDETASSTSAETEKSEKPADMAGNMIVSAEGTLVLLNKCGGCPLYYKGDANLGGFYYWENDTLCYTTSPDVHTIQYCATCDVPPEGEPHWYPLTIAVEEKADCTHDGYSGVKCNCCGGWKNVTVTPALGHDYVEIRREEPTCTSKGKIIYQCSRHSYIESLFGNYLVGCADEKTEELPLANHKWKFDMSTLTAKCEVCGAEKKIGLLRQYDDKWKKLTFFNTTIGSKGCLLTSLTMKYNFDKNKNYTPDKFLSDVLGNDSFTSDASYIWAKLGKKLGYSHSELQDNNAALTQEQMSKIHENVSKGNPVVLGAKDENNKQHYCLVVSYNSSDTKTFNTDDFIIFDPGHPDNNTLTDLFKEKPYVRTFIW